MDARQDRPLNAGAMSAAGPIVRIRNVTKRFGLVTAVDAVNLDIARGEFFCLLGGSGSGKTTLLRMIAGLETPDAGEIEIDGEDVTGAPAYARPVNMMFQSYALFPHLTVEKNVGFGLQEEGRPKAEIAARVGEALGMLDMEGFASRKQHQLSGGQRQRVALARALVKHPKILLLDEPLAALDKKLRERAQGELVRLRERVGITFIVVTHDQEEAMSMASRIALMQDGRIAQIGSPRELYDAPVSRYVADFFGGANLFAGNAARSERGETRVESAEAGAPLRGQGEASPGAEVTLVVRPEQVRLSREKPIADNVLQGRIASLVFLGGFHACELVLDSGKTVQARLTSAELANAGSPAPGERIHLFWPASAARVLSQ
ncbi:MAG TPA: ABC transporter ATP-binding protein [Xanthobacteraceae bacterium]|nr:ABC transporter ATP-binding protein [Xanthobacteraceae bacterium]